ncbi:MAG TPA: prenyltransferase/squalene oxidase repeat-containing protein [Solirubrobacteraceae bacterium]|nr:prenyltransferase/squalene oxidase repeat-containing protein [Solirubrobacteraceae bacterium]
MSWPLASFVVVALVLGVGWAAFERSRPSARTIALVATLAALAALGRDAFAALPEVKPITAMTFTCGFALGPLEGFTVGALGMLASNILLGEGPYTPWQMAAWGLVGLLGALAGSLSGRRMPRVALAGACALSAAIAKEIMNLYVFSLGGIYTPSAYLARVAEGLPFDLTDVVATFLFGLAFAPELAAVLARVRRRLHVEWLPVSGALCALLMAFAVAPPAARATATASALARGRAYLERAQGPSGGFGQAPGAAESELYSAWAAIGLAGAGRDPARLARDGHSLPQALRAGAASLEGPGDIERTMLALHACGLDARALGARNLESELLAAQAPDGSISEQVNLSAFAILALRAAGIAQESPAIQRLARWLEGQQGSDGGFSYGARSAGGGARSDADDTGAVLEALAAAGVRSGPIVAHAIAYLRALQGGDGGFPQEAGGEANSQSTAWALQGLDAVGVQGGSLARAGGRSALSYLLSLQEPDGAFRYSRESSQTPVWVTAEVLPALASRPLPIGAPIGAEAGDGTRGEAAQSTAAIATESSHSAPAAAGGGGGAAAAMPPHTRPPALFAGGSQNVAPSALALSAALSESLRALGQRALAMLQAPQAR